MSDSQSRPSAPRGRGSSRVSRGGGAGYGARGGASRGGGRSKSNGDQSDQSPELKYAEEGEIGELKRKYSGQLITLKELFPDWTDEDLVFALEETDGDLEGTVDRITEGNMSQWGEVKKKSKERSRSKAQEPTQVSATDQNTASTGRGSRGGRANVEGRGGRGRGTERGRKSGRGGRGGSAAPANGTWASGTNTNDVDSGKTSIPTEESSAWEVSAASAPAQKVQDDDWGTFTTPEQTGDNGDWGTGASTEHTAVPDAKKSSIIPDGTKKSWASMFAKPAPPPVPKNIPPPPAAQPIEQQVPEVEALPPPPPSADITDTVMETSTDMVVPGEPDPMLTPPKDQLTESNLEQVLDTSVPPATATQAGTVASSRMTPAPAGTGTPYSVNHQYSTARPTVGGFGSGAFRATGAPGRSTSFQRRVLDQQEAVVMPNNPAVDRASVQFGSLGLNGNGEEADVDEEREEAETRAQPPQHSPVAHPVTSLPPAPHQSLPPHQSPRKETEPTPRQAPGLPIPPQSQQSVVPQQTPTQSAMGVQSVAQQSLQGNQPYGQFNRYAQTGTQQDQPATAQRYDAFGQQANQTTSNQNQFEGYTSQNATQPAQAQQQQYSNLGAFSSAPSDYSSYYTSDPQSRGGYPNYYNTMYNQQSGLTPQDAGAGQQRTGSGIGQSATDTSHYPTSQAQQLASSRYGQIADSHPSGQSTPNPVLTGQQPQQHQQHLSQQSQQQATQSQQSQHLQGQQPQTQAGGHNAAYPYGHPYYSSPYYTAYMSQYGYGQGYGAPFGKQAGPYGQPSQGYGISPQTSYEHSSSPANVGAYAQSSLHGRDSGLGGGLTDYGRTGSAQAAHSQQHSVGSGAFGGMPDVFARYGSQATQPLGQHPGNTQDDPLKGYGDKITTTGGPSPSMTSLAGRSELSNSIVQGGGQAGVVPQSQQSSNQPTGSAYGGYHLNPHHHLHTNQGGHYGTSGTGGAAGAGGLGGSGAGTGGLTGGGAAAHHHLPGVGVGVGGGNQSHHHFNHQQPSAAAAAATVYGSYPSTSGYGAGGVGNYYATTGNTGGGGGGGGRGAGGAAGAGVGGVGTGWGGYGAH
ncbi:MAG: hypothetical protein M1816_003571 [Peltula sp. TS41687]|nr:MAG: hypothetical protein M1816_003571 [Peltula sp. TS41687]